VLSNRLQMVVRDVLSCEVREMERSSQAPIFEP
jgi:hypothetical protein